MIALSETKKTDEHTEDILLEHWPVSRDLYDAFDTFQSVDRQEGICVLSYPI